MSLKGGGGDWKRAQLLYHEKVLDSAKTLIQ